MSKQSASNAAEKPKEAKNEKEQEKFDSADKGAVDEGVEPESREDEASNGVESNSPEEENTVDDESQESGTAAAEDVADELEAEEEEEIPLSDEERHQVEVKELNDKYMRLAAEFENFKKRTNQEMQSRFKFASQPLAVAIISGLDSLERAIEQANQAIEEKDIKQFQEFVSGIDLVKQQFFDAFKNNNIERDFPKGELFDPNKHDAMAVVESEEVEPDHIAEVFQAGYYLHDRVIRPAMVQVTKKK